MGHRSFFQTPKVAPESHSKFWLRFPFIQHYEYASFLKHIFLGKICMSSLWPSRFHWSIIRPLKSQPPLPGRLRCRRLTGKQQDPLHRSKMVLVLGGGGDDGHVIPDVPSGNHSSFSKSSFIWNICSMNFRHVFSFSGKMEGIGHWDLSFFSFLSYKHEETALSKNATKLGQPRDISSLHSSHFSMFYVASCSHIRWK